MKKSGKETPHEVKKVSGPEVKEFISLCEVHNITPTKRQLSKFRNKKGRLYNIINKSEA